MSSQLGLELAANAFNTICILLAGRNNVHTWWTGIVGCCLFGWLFWGTQLYADATLQAFFVVTGVIGWWNWEAGNAGRVLQIRRSHAHLLAFGGSTAALVTAGYGLALQHYTDAFAPFWDSAVLAFSVLGQLLLMARRLETWWCWLLVNTIAVPLYASRELWLTSCLYVVFWINALVSLGHWRALSGERGAEVTAS